MLSNVNMLSVFKSIVLENKRVRKLSSSMCDPGQGKPDVDKSKGIRRWIMRS